MYFRAILELALENMFGDISRYEVSYSIINVSSTGYKFCLHRVGAKAKFQSLAAYAEEIKIQLRLKGGESLQMPEIVLGNSLFWILR